MTRVQYTEKPNLEDWQLVAKFCRHLTPEGLADTLAKYVLAANPKRILDPCYGEGALIRSVLKRLKRYPKKRQPEIIACDVLDGECDKELLINKVTIVRGDFLRWKDSMGQEKGVDAVICNPPYIGNRNLPLRVRGVVKKLSEDNKIKLPGNSNYWIFFLLHSLVHLRKGGRIAFILPTSWKYADYAKEIRNLIRASFEKVEEESLPEPVFETSREGTELLFASGFFGNEVCKNFINGFSPSNRDVVCSGQSLRLSRAKLISLGEVIRINIGIVCGGVKFFLLNKSKMKDLGIGHKYVLPVVSNTKHLKAPILDRKQFEDLDENDERLWLFYPRDKSFSKVVRNYIEEGERLRFNEALWCRRREPWYLTQIKPPSNFILSGMVREYPLICVNESKVFATNTLYIGNWKNEKYEGMEIVLLAVLFSDLARKSVMELARKYPDGLLKFEPCDLMAWKIPDPREISLNGLQKKEMKRLFKQNKFEEINKIINKLICNTDSQ
ncbi:MAG: N-6 DNA methylase [Gammaproteobacteria bacterium]|nr:N-6 DNA methylase [Gammaproteobacteria bacterium]